MSPAELLDRPGAARFTAAHLTTVGKKADHYSAEAVVREALAEVARVTEPVAALRATGLGVFRPDAIAFGKVRPCLRYLRRLGIVPFHLIVTDVGAAAVRRLWRYQLNAASPERLRLLDLVYEASPSIVALFRSTGDLPLPCSVVMADAKGQADPARREGWELRSVLGSPNRIEVYFHAADEPADVVREGAILLGPRPLATALAHRTTAADVTDQVAAVAAGIAAATGPAGERWSVVRSLATASPMFRAGERNLIAETGGRGWWERAGLLADRPRLLASLVSPSGGRADGC